MPKRQILVLDKKQSVWKDFLREYFEDTTSRVEFFDEINPFSLFIDRAKPDIIFFNQEFNSPAILQKLKSHKAITPDLRIFRIGTQSAPDQDTFDASFLGLPVLYPFQKQFVQYLPHNEKIAVLVADDENEIGKMIRDYLEGRKQPSFDVSYAENGKRALDMIRQAKPDVLILDIKMPVMDGRDVYREIRQKQLGVPVIIFFDSVAAEEMLEIRKCGNPAVVEKGARESAMPEMMALIKKLAYFG